MIDLIKKIYWFLSPYLNAEEKNVARAINSLNVDRVLTASQKNIILLSVFLERFQKGYQALSKDRRKQIYENVEKLGFEFSAFLDENNFDKTIPSVEFFSYLKVFLHDSKRFKYQESTFLGGMSNHSQIVGDCNQIVTLYVYFWSLFFDITLLRIKLPKNHIVLCFDEYDIEATNGTLVDEYRSLRKLPIIELIVVNLLDVADFREKQFDINPKNMLLVSRLAHKISYSSEIVIKNLNIAINNLGIEYLKKNKFRQALDLFMETGNQDLILQANTSAVKYFVEKKKFKQALKFAKKQSNLIQFVRTEWVLDLVQSKKYAKAMRVSKGHVELVRYINSKEYSTLLSQLPTSIDVNAQKKYRSVIKRAYKLAVLLDDKKNIEQLSKLL